MAFTVTATQSGSSSQRGMYLLVRVLTNATEAGGATSGGANAAAGTAAGSLTPNFSSSWVGFSISADAVGSMAAAAANNTYDFSNNDVTDGWANAQGHYTGTVTASSALTYGAGSANGSDHENWCAYEVPASGGTIAVDGSSPTLASTESAAFVTTAAFSPPANAVVVALVAVGGTGSGTGITVTMSSGGGLVWTRRAVSSTSDNFQPTFIFTATVPAGTTQTTPALARTSRTWQRRFNHFVRPNIPPSRQQLAPNAGVATVSAVAPAIPRYIQKIGGSGYNSWLTDQYGNPKLMLLEQGWALIFNGGRWNSGNWQSDFDTYFSVRSSQGYNAWYGIAWGNTHVDSTALTGGRTWDGVYPLNVNGTPGAIATGSETITLNSSFWSRVDYFFNSAQRNGVTCFLNMSMSYDVSDAGGIWQHATNTQGTAFGAALAARYPQSSYPNVQWFFGDDDSGSLDSFYSAILSGIQGAGDTRGLISEEQITNTNCHVEFDNGTAFGGTFAGPNATYNWVYSYCPPYYGVERSYTEGGTFAHIPPVYGDGVYYGDNGAGSPAEVTIRRFVWWALASGARGVCATSGPSDLGGGGLWTWQSDAISRLTSDPNGTFTTSTIGAITSYIGGLTDWNKLIPDTGNVFITAGRGTRGTADAPGASFNFPTGNTYVAGSITPGGTLAVIYCASSMSITIDQTKMGSGYTATWVDPASLATQSATTGSTYSSSGLGNNSAGNADWALVLQAPPSVNATAGVATVSVVSVQPSTAVTVTAGVATAAAAAPAPVAALAATAGVSTVLTVAPAATDAESATAGVAPVLAVAPAASDAETVNAGVATVLAAAPAPVPAVAATAGVATVLVVATAATVSTSGGTNAPAGVATVSVIATAATVSDTATAGVPTVLAAAPAPSIAETATAGVAVIQAIAPAASAADTATAGAAAVSAVSAPPVPAVVVTAGVATVLAADPGATVNTSGSTNAVAAPAVVLAIAAAPSPAIVVVAGVAAVQVVATAATAGSGKVATAGVATVSSAALASASLTVAATAQAARVLAAGVDVPPVFTLGALTAADRATATLTASDQRTGGPS